MTTRVLVALGSIFALILALSPHWSSSRAAAQTPADSAAIASELRQLRITIEQGMARQTQAEGIGLALSAHQARVASLGERLDATRRDLAAASARVIEANTMLNEFNRAATTVPIEEQDSVRMMLDRARNDANSAARAEQQLRAQESELIGLLQQAEANWQQLVARMSGMIGG